MNIGTVIKTTGAQCLVALDDGSTVEARIRGKIRLDGIKSTNPVAVGDRVEIDGESITAILPRKNYIIRKSMNWSKQSQVIAANVDLLALVVTLCHPQTPNEFIDRMLTVAEAYNVPAMLVFNKADLFDDGLDELYAAYKNLYEQIGYPCLRVSTMNNEGMDELKEKIKGKICLFSGNSGVGKTSITNALCPGLDLRTAEISSYHDKGMHTTTFSQMLPFAGGYIIDTPGIKGFGLIDFDRHEVGHFFPEIFKTSKQCRFADCTHTNEPGCAVKTAVENHKISQSRYASYLSILADTGEKYR